MQRYALEKSTTGLWLVSLRHAFFPAGSHRRASSSRRHRVCHDMTNRSSIGSWQHLGAVLPHLSLPTRFISGLTRVKYRCRLCKILYE